MATVPTAKVLIFAADPKDQKRLRLDEEIRRIVEAWKKSPLRDRWAVKSSLAARPNDLRAELLAEDPLVVHFCGHGTGADGLVLEDQAGQGQQVSTAALEDLFRLFKDTVACVVLNSCYSAVQAAAIAEHIPYVVGMTQEIGDPSAIEFAVGFFDALFAGEVFDRAFEFGRNAIPLASLPANVTGGWSARFLSTNGVAPAQILPEELKPLLLGRGGPVDRLPRPDAGPDRDVVVRFNERFQQRKRQLGYLRAYKQFHDILHDLHDYGPQIDKAVAGLTRPPADGPSPQSVADTLDEWRTAARRSVGETEFPDHPPRWIKRFETAVAEVLAGLSTGVADAPQAEKVARAAQVLGNLPAEVQVELNEDLLNSALRLNTDELIELMNKMLVGLVGSGADPVRARVESFRQYCQSLKGLIDDHDRCQKVDGALQEAVGLVGKSPSLPSQWADVCVWLDAIVAARPGHLYASRAAESASLFGKVADDPKQAGPVLALFRERFEKLFFQTDKDLLELTKDLVTAAEVLDAALGGFRK